MNEQMNLWVPAKCERTTELLGVLKLLRHRKWFNGFTLIQLCVYYSTVFLCLYFRIHNEEKHVAIKLCNNQSNRRMKNRKHGSTFYNYEAIVVVLLSWADSSFFSFARHMNKYDKKINTCYDRLLVMTDRETDRPTDLQTGS